MHFLCQVSSFFETSYISQDDSALACARLGSLYSRAPLARRVPFAALQIDLSVRGWKTFGGLAALKAISSQTIASPNESTSRS